MGLCVALCALNPARSAATPGTSKGGKYHHDLASFKSDLNVPLILKNRNVLLTDKMIEDRLDGTRKDDRVEPLQLTVDGRDDKIVELATKIAIPGHQLDLANYLKSNFPKGEELPGTNLRLVTIDKVAFRYINGAAFKSLFAKVHRDLAVPGNAFTKAPHLRESLITQMSPFFKASEIATIRRKMASNQALSVDRDLLPSFARQNIASFSPFRGPNCFHAALSFQGAELASNRTVNVRKEPGYHDDMINYDELWRVLRISFYEVDPTKSPMQYGDMIVFFETNQTSDEDHSDYKSLRHAATYLFDGYVYSKGSKSANSPYLVRTLAEEWETWTKYTDKMGVKVFRRSLKNVSNAAPVDPVDWVY